jgi:hypothetical protein
VSLAVPEFVALDWRPDMRFARLLGAAVLAAVMLVVPVRPALAGPVLPGFAIETIGFYGYAVVGQQASIIQVATTMLTFPEQTISFDVVGMPAGSTWQFDPGQVVAGGSSWLLATVPVGTPSGFYLVTVIGYGETQRTTKFSLMVP